MKTSGGINQNDIGTIGFGTLEGVEGHAGRVGAHLLLHHRNPYAVAPYLNLLHSSGTEGVGSTKIDFLPVFLKLISKFSDGRCLADAVDSYNEDDVWLVVGRKIPVGCVAAVVLRQQVGNGTPEDTVELGCRYILVAGYTLLDAVDNLYRCVDTDIRGYENLLKIVKDIVVDLRFSGDGTGKLRKNTLLGFLKTLIESLLLFLIEA